MADTNATDPFRLFIALRVPEAVQVELERAQSELRRAITGPEIRWTKREQLHLTLRFMGNVEAHRLENLIEALRTTGASFAPLRMRAAGLGFFPKGRPPSVVWAGVRDQAGQLAALQRAVQAATAAFTSEMPDEKFTGHITLGRIKSLRRPESEALARLALGMIGCPFGDWIAPELELFRSQISEHGATHTCISRAPLAQHFP